eukprot:872614-Rhodomonas_salina.1
MRRERSRISRSWGAEMRRMAQMMARMQATRRRVGRRRARRTRMQRRIEPATRAGYLAKVAHKRRYVGWETVGVLSQSRCERRHECSSSMLEFSLKVLSNSDKENMSARSPDGIGAPQPSRLSLLCNLRSTIHIT